MIKYLICFSLAFLFTNSLMGQSVNGKMLPFVEFVNQNKTSIRLDEEVIDDKKFALKIPQGLINWGTEISNCFVQILDFKNDSKIVLIYLPNRDSSMEFKSQVVSYKKFKQICEMENIMEYMSKITLMPRRCYGLNKLERGCFYAIYLNVKKRDANAFEYSINSIQFK